ncbi:MAG: 30S ribosomal protein S12 methylthiotransferase RimO [Deltaproteobacteria bacterium]|nr:30S ribosomal protein S12 methylthiotransferase RimO [Deltaproteobacteria bacterium]
MKLHITSLGCAKNLVDTELMLGMLLKSGFILTEHPEEAETIIINTCSFIESAINESIDTILELAEFKKNGNCRRLIAVGCLPERFREKIADALPEVDVFLGTGAFDKILEAVNGSLNPGSCYLPRPDLLPLQNSDDSRCLSASHMAYIKIAEGCDKKCTYCIIPRLRGKQKSRLITDIVAEADRLISAGVKEVLLVAQETTDYGRDLTSCDNLAKLLEELSKISDDIWIRVLYSHPESINETLIKTIALHDNICSYYDIPIQHASNAVLKRMGRQYTRDDLYKLFESIRLIDPQAALRTTVMTGFPGETERDFQELLNFIQEIRFTNLGAFIYSDSDDIPSHGLPDHVNKERAQERYDVLMSIQAEISLENNRMHIDKVYKILLEEESTGDNFKGRAFFQAPEVDGITYINSNISAADLHAGDFAMVRITGANEYDLTGEAI